MVDFYPRIFAIIFCRTKLETQDIADKLIKDGYNAEALHGDLSQQQRDLTMQKFRNHTVQFLVATDVAARGLDVDDLTHVINYGLPDDVASYTHRSGRTGRAGKKGTSISIIHTREKFKVRQIEKQIGKEFVDGVLPTPEEICKKQLFKTMDDIMKTDVDEDQIEPYMAEINRQFEYIDKEDIIKKMVTITFGKFLDYYKNAPEIIKPETGKGSRGGEGRGSRGEGRGKVVEVAKHIKPSARGELEITTVNQEFLKDKQLKVQTMARGFAWLDTGTHDSLSEASTFIEVLEKRQGLKVACLEGIAYRQGWITAEQLRENAQPMLKNDYGKYLLSILEEKNQTLKKNLEY